LLKPVFNSYEYWFAPISVPEFMQQTAGSFMFISLSTHVLEEKFKAKEN